MKSTFKVVKVPNEESRGISNSHCKGCVFNKGLRCEMVVGGWQENCEGVIFVLKHKKVKPAA